MTDNNTTADMLPATTVGVNPKPWAWVAYEVTHETVEWVKALCSGYHHKYDKFFQGHLNDSGQTVSLGYWMVRDPLGRWGAFTADDYRDRFKEELA